MLSQAPLPRCLRLQAMCTASCHLTHSRSLTSQPSSIPSEQGGQQFIALNSPLPLLLLTLTLTARTYLLSLPTLGSPRCTRRPEPPHLPPALLPSLLPPPLEPPSSMADPELHRRPQLTHCLLEQQVHRLLPVSCLRPKEQVLRMVGMILPL